MEKNQKNITKIIVALFIVAALVVVGLWVSWVIVERSPDTYATKVVAYYKALSSSSTNLSMVAPGFTDTTGIVLSKGYELYKVGLREIAESNQMVLEYVLVNKEGRTKKAYIAEALFMKSVDPKIMHIVVNKRGNLIEK